MKDPLVAHCITGALRSFPEPRVFGSLREKLLDAFSSRYKVFVVVSFDCRVRTVDYLNASKSSHRASCAKDYFTSDIDRALAYLGAESFEVVPNRNAPSVDCPSARGEVDRHPAYWLQQQKTQRCVAAVEHYERESGVCFDWVVRTRPDDLWKVNAPPAVSLPRNMVSTGATWPWFAPLQHWARTNYSAIDDHFMAAPRKLADLAMKRALDTWRDCRSLADYELVCPSKMLYYFRDHGISDRAMMTSECLLGLHLRSHGVRWRVDGRFSYVMRRVPGGLSNESYTRMLAAYPMRHPDRFAEYKQLEEAVERHSWGEADLLRVG